VLAVHARTEQLDVLKQGQESEIKDRDTRGLVLGFGDEVILIYALKA
jgi:uncharacterized Zn ribbon protein